MNELLRPRWLVGHVLAIAAVVSFIALGFWQLRRHDEKSMLRDAVAEAQAMPVVPIEEAESGAYRRVSAVGEYDPLLQAKVLRSRAGLSGYHVVTPFLYGDNVAVLVNRGWIPLDMELPAPPEGPVAISGTLWPPEEGSSIPDSMPEAVRRIDPEIQQAFAEYEFLDAYLLLNGDGESPQAFPAPPEDPEIPLGPHLGYAGQWFLFTVIVVVGYPMLLRKRAAAVPPHRAGRRSSPPPR